MADVNKSPRTQLPRVARHAEWLDDFTKGATYQQIAEKHGVSRSTVHDAVHRQLGRARDRRDGLADVALEQQLRRLDWLWQQAADAITEARDGREMGVAQLIASAKGVVDSTTKLLGLDNGVTVNVRSDSLLDQEIAALTERMSLIIDGETVDDPAAELPAASGDDDGR